MKTTCDESDRERDDIGCRIEKSREAQTGNKNQALERWTLT